jgi:hypothetical protein
MEHDGEDVDGGGVQAMLSRVDRINKKAAEREDYA